MLDSEILGYKKKRIKVGSKEEIHFYNKKLNIIKITNLQILNEIFCSMDNYH